MFCNTDNTCIHVSSCSVIQIIHTYMYPHVLLYKITHPLMFCNTDNTSIHVSLCSVIRIIHAFMFCNTDNTYIHVSSCSATSTCTLDMDWLNCPSLHVNYILYMSSCSSIHVNYILIG